MPVESIPNEDEPLDPAVEKVRRRMVRLLVISVVIMMVGLLSVLGSIVYKINQASDDSDTKQETPVQTANVPAGSFTDGTIELPGGAKVVAATTSGANLVITLQLADGGSQILIVDGKSAEPVARYELR